MNRRGAYAAAPTGAGAYAQVGVETGVMSASPHQLVVMLFDGAQMAIRTARLHMTNGNVAEKGKAIARALDIITQGLMAGLDREKGGEIADNLASLYDYVGRLLLQASVRNDVAKLDQAEALLTDIASAWREIGGQATD